MSTYFMQSYIFSIEHRHSRPIPTEYSHKCVQKVSHAVWLSSSKLTKKVKVWIWLNHTAHKVLYVYCVTVLVSKVVQSDFIKEYSLFKYDKIYPFGMLVI